MTRKSAVQTPEVPGTDLDYRPRDYFSAAGLNIPLLSAIAGETRRQSVRGLIDGSNPIPDFYFINDGSVCLLRPITEAAKAWVDDHVCLDKWQSASSVAIEHRYVIDILKGIVADGLVVA